MVKSGSPLAVATALPGLQGPTITGKQGIGIRTGGGGTNGGEADCAAMIWGFNGELHIPKGTIFANGTIAVISATGNKLATVPVTGSTINVLGAKPYEHLVMAVLETKFVIDFSGP